MLVAWAGIAMSLVSIARSRPALRHSNCRQIVVSESGNHIAAVYHNRIVLYRNGRYTGTIEIESFKRLKFVDEETLAVVNTGSDLPFGVNFYSLEQRKFTRHLPLDRKLRTNVIFLDNMILVQQVDGKLRGHFQTFDLNADAESRPRESYTSPTMCMPFDATNDGRFIAFYTGEGWTKAYAAARIQHGFSDGFDLHTNERLALPECSSVLAFAPDDSLVVTCTDEITLRQWPTGEKRWSVPCRTADAIRFSPQGSMLAIRTDSAEQPRVHAYTLESGEKLVEIELNSKYGNAYAFSADGKSIWIAAPDDEGGLIKWDIASNSMGARIGSINVPWTVLYYTVLFIGWSAVFDWLGPKPTHTPHTSLLAGTFLFCGIGFLVFGYYSVFGSDRFMNYLSLVQLLVGTEFICLAFRFLRSSTRIIHESRPRLSVKAKVPASDEKIMFWTSTAR